MVVQRRNGCAVPQLRRVPWQSEIQWLGKKNCYPYRTKHASFASLPRALTPNAAVAVTVAAACRMDTRQPTSLMHTARRMSWKRKDERHSFSSFIYPSISPCGRYVACAADWNGCFHIWDVRSGRTDPMQARCAMFALLFLLCIFSSWCS